MEPDGQCKNRNFHQRTSKRKALTQKELANLLHVTDRAVSKWERGLCAPDISLLEPLAAALDVTIVELLSGEHGNSREHTANPESVAKKVIDYSEGEIAQKTKAFTRKVIAYILSAFLLFFLLIPTLNGLIVGEGFAWRCIPAYLCARKAAQAIETLDEESIQKFIGNSDDMFSALLELEAQGVHIWNAKAKFFQTRLDDMFLNLEVELIVLHEDIKYQFNCSGTYRNGKVELMNIVNPSVGQDYHAWILQLNDALPTYYPG